MAAEIKGHCLCGQVTYEAEGEPAMQVFCHCKDCQRASGSVGTFNLGVPVPAFSVTGDSLSSFETIGEDRGTPATRRFCSNCGSPIAVTLPEFPDLVFIKAGTLEDTSWLAPQLEIWGCSAQPWMRQAEGVDRLERGPSAATPS